MVTFYQKAENGKVQDPKEVQQNVKLKMGKLVRVGVGLIKMREYNKNSEAPMALRMLKPII